MRNWRRLQRFCGVLLILVACAAFSSASEFQDPPPSASNPRAEAAAAFARGQQALQTGDLATADASFQKVLSIDPQAAPAYANLGVIAMRRQQWDHALNLLQKAEKLDPKMSGIRLNIALVKYRREDYVGAIPPLESVLRDQPNSRPRRATSWVCASFTPSITPMLSRPSSPSGRLRPATSCISTPWASPLTRGTKRAGRKSDVAPDRDRLRHAGISSDPRQGLPQPRRIRPSDRPTAKAEAANPNLPYVHFGLGIAYMKSDDNEPPNPN